MEKMTDFCIEFDNKSTIKMKKLCRVVKQMPLLKNLMLAGLRSKEQTLQLFRKLVVFATSQGKDVIVFQHFYERKNDVTKRLKISRKGVRQVVDPSEQNQTLNMLIAKGRCYTHLDDVKAFVEANMKDHEIFVINAKDNVSVFELFEFENCKK